MQAFIRFVLRFRWPVLLSVLALSGLLGALSMGLPTNNNYETWLPEKDRATVLYRETDREFASNALLFVVLEFPERGVFHPESLAEIQRLTEVFESVPELFYVMSLTNIVDIRAIENGVSVDDLIKEIPQDPKALSRLKDYVLSKEMYVNSIVSEDGKRTVLLMNIDGEYDEVKVAAKVYDLLVKQAKGLTYYFGGDPALAHYSDLYMQRDMKVLLPIMFLVMVLILAFGLRRFWGVVLPLTVVILSILWTLGFQWIFHMPLNLLTTAVLVMLIAMGSDYSVHVINHYLRIGEIQKAGVGISVPILMSAVTTIAGLLTFGTTQIAVLKEFGFELAIGLGSACLLSLTFLIAMLRILRPKPEPSAEGIDVRPEASRRAGGDPADPHLFGRFLEWLTIRLLRHTRLVIWGIVLLVVFMGLGIFRIHTNVDFVTFFPEESQPRRGHEILQTYFSGIYPVSLYFRGDIEEPSVLMMQLRMENDLRKNPRLSSFTSLGGTIAEMNRTLTGTYAVPESRAGVASLWLLMDGEPYLRTMVNDERDKALVSAIVRDSSTDMMKKVARFVKEAMPFEGTGEILTLDPTLLSDEGQARLAALQMEEAARQLAALQSGYSKGEESSLPSSFLGRITRVWGKVMATTWNQRIEHELNEYLMKEAVVTPEEQVRNKLLEMFRNHFPRDPVASWRPEMRDLLVRRAGLDSRDAQILEEGALWRCREELRKEKVHRFEQALLSGLPKSLLEDPDFHRRARGVLWELTSEKPVCWASQCASISGIREAVLNRVPVELDQTGAPIFFKKFDELLYRSQIQSLLLASLVVFLLVSITQRSLRRGFVSILAVLVPLEIVIGLMGWTGIPLDFGTALFGALIIGLGIDGCIHILHYEAGLRSMGLPEEESLVKTLRHVGRAILTANVTTAGGFAVLIFSATDMVKNFAMVNVLAISLVTASIVTLLPVLIKISRVFAAPPAAKKKREGPGSSHPEAG